MDAARRAELIARYRSGHAVIAESLAGIDEAGLDARPADGGWTPREVVHHTADSEMTSATSSPSGSITPTDRSSPPSRRSPAPGRRLPRSSIG